MLLTTLVSCAAGMAAGMKFDYGTEGFPEAFYKPFQQAVVGVIKEKRDTEQNCPTKEFVGDEHTVKLRWFNKSG